MFLTSNIRVQRRSYRNEFGGYQYLLKEWRLFGMKVWETVLDSEEIPAWAEIQLGSLGYTDWESKFAEYIK